VQLESLPGSVLDQKYRVERQLGKGAMGAVFQATHLGTTRPVALKVIVPKLAENLEFAQRFKREGESSGLKHRNAGDSGGAGRLAFEGVAWRDSTQCKHRNCDCAHGFAQPAEPLRRPVDGF
jgi:hypothetical protein